MPFGNPLIWTVKGAVRVYKSREASLKHSYMTRAWIGCRLVIAVIRYLKDCGTVHSHLLTCRTRYA